MDTSHTSCLLFKHFSAFICSFFSSVSVRINIVYLMDIVAV